MTTENNNRYGKNRNKWKTVYPYYNRKARTISFVNQQDFSSSSYDGNKTQRHYDYFSKETTFISSPSVAVEYEEGLVYFTGGVEITGSFSTTFSGNPIVVYTMEDSGSLSNVNLFGTSIPSATSFTVGASAPFSGAIRYRAAFAPPGAGYPAAVSTAATSSFSVFAGKRDVSNVLEYTASYSLPSGTLVYRATIHDNTNNVKHADTYLNKITSSFAVTTNTITAEVKEQIHFIVTSE